MKLPCGKDWLFGLVLVIATLAAYQPVWHGQRIWDDAGHLTPPELRSLDGLGRIWTHVGATQQYYPLSFTAFWVQDKLWGSATPGYHFVNILLHCLSALLFLTILRRLEVPGTYLAAAIFALHPIYVESVAWMTQLKNTLSGVLYLGSAVVYLDFDRARSKGLYAAALGLFLLALMSKTAAVTLPAALLVVLWWKRGELSWKRDVQPLLPFLAAALAAGLLTIYLERNLYGARGRYFQFSLVERCLIAGRSFWFHLSKLLWPANLLFMYPRWEVNPAAWRQYLYPATVLLLLAGAWRLRHRVRAPLAALLLFAGTLFPTLGFFNACTFRYSFVNDHHQYLAGLGIIALVSAGAALAAGSRRRFVVAGILPAVEGGILPPGPEPPSAPTSEDPSGAMPGSPAGRIPDAIAYTGSSAATGRRLWFLGLALLLLATLATLTWRQSRMYADVDTLWRTTVARNPGCYFGWENLGSILFDRGQVDQAIAHFRKALEICPDYAECHNDLGVALEQKGQIDEAVAEYQKALEAHSGLPSAHINLGNALAREGRRNEAMAHYQWALAAEPDNGKIYASMGHALFEEGELEAAMTQLQRAIALLPTYAPAYDSLGMVLLRKGQADEAVAQFQQALRCQPDFTVAQKNLGDAFVQLGQADKAIAELTALLRTRPNDAGAHCSLAAVFSAQGQTRDAIQHYRAALRAHADLPEALNNLAWILAASPEPDLRNGAEAVALAERACKLTDSKQPMLVGTLAAAYAEAGRFSDAVASAQKAAALADQANQPELAARNRKLAELYRAGQPYHETGSQHQIEVKAPDF